MQTPIATVLANRPREVLTVEPGMAAQDAVQLMVDKRNEALLVLEDHKLVGIMTERDCARRIWLPGKDARRMGVAEVMTSPVVFVSPRHTVADGLRILSDRGFSHLPVLDEDRIIGMVELADLVYGIVHEKKQTIGHLEAYITGRYG